MALITKLPRIPGQGMRDNYDPAHGLQQRAAVGVKRGAGHKIGRKTILRMPRIPHMRSTRPRKRT
jgi:hypothetical protein